MRDDILEVLGPAMLPIVKERFNEYLTLLQESFKKKDFELYKGALLKFYILAKTSKSFVGMEPFQEVFDKCGMLLYIEGEELKLIQKTNASQVLFKKE